LTPPTSLGGSAWVVQGARTLQPKGDRMAKTKRRVPITGMDMMKGIVREALEEDKKEQRENRENEKQLNRYKMILENLAELGGRVFHDDDILFQGNKLIIPEGMTISMAKSFLERKEEELERETEFNNVFNYRP